MEVKIELPDKFYDEIVKMCDFNGITITKYAFDCILDNYNTMKYGDLNERLGLNKKEEKEEQVVVEKKKVGRPRKKVELKKQEIVEEKVVEEPKKEEEITIKKTRILKSK